MIFFRRLLDALFEQHERWILWTPALIGLGIGGYFSLSVEPPLWAGPLALALSLLFWRKKFIFLPLFLAALGFSAAQMRAYDVAAPPVTHKTSAQMLTGRVAGVELLPQGFRVTLAGMAARAGAVRLVSRIRETPPRVGAEVAVRAVLLPPSGPVAPGAYDFGRHLFFLGIAATGYTLSPFAPLSAEEEGFFDALRRMLGDHIRAAVADKDAAAITTALLYGEEKGISKQTYADIRGAGLAHLIAISGLQITLVTGFFFFAVRAGLAAVPAAALRWPVKKIAAAAALAGAVFYLLLIGDNVPSTRSVIMVCVVMGAILLDRDPLTLRMAAFAACLILLLRPESLFGPSFQLSFAAVVALISFYEAVKDRFIPKERGFARLAGFYFLGSLATTLIATLATAPISLYHFLSAPLLPGLAANLVAVPLSSFVTMPAGIIGCLLIPFGLEGAPFRLAAWSVRLIMETARIASGWPYALFHVDAWPFGAFLAIMFGVLWACLWRGRLRLWGVLPAVLGIVMALLAPRADVLVSGDGKIFAARVAGGRLALSPGRAGGFVREQWMLREGGPGAGAWPSPPELRCDAQACLYSKNGAIVSFVTGRAALERDCAAAQVVVSWLFIDPAACRGPRFVIDGHALRRLGSVALYIGENGEVTLRSAQRERGARPWAGESGGAGP